MSKRSSLPLLLALAACGVTPPPAPLPTARVEAPAPKPPELVTKAEPPKEVEPAAKPAPAPAAKPTPAPPRKPAPAPAPAPVASPPPKPVPPPLDLKSLEQRLKETSAIGVLTKLSLKNQVDDLIDRFRAFHEGRRPPTLTELRPAFELLLMKVMSLLQDRDRALANDINASRDAIWGLLSDRERLSRYN